MTPTLYGRWQTRLLLLSTIGSLMTYLVGLSFTDVALDPTPLWYILGYVILIGFAWDSLYDFWLEYRWDSDWPPAFQFVTGITEAIFIYFLATQIGLPGIPQAVAAGENFNQIFVTHYSLVWLTTFIASQGLLRIIFPRWRYRGGQWMMFNQQW